MPDDFTRQWGTPWAGKSEHRQKLSPFKHEHILNDNTFSLKTNAEWKTEIL